MLALLAALALPVVPPHAAVLPTPVPCTAYITTTVWPGDTAFTNAENYTVEYGFSGASGCTPPGEMNPYSFTFTRLSPRPITDLTSYFSVGGMQAVGTGVPLNVDASNTMTACVTWTDWSYVDHTICDTKTSYMNSTPGPRINPTPYVWDAQDLARCAQSCFAATTSFTTVPYFVLGAPRSVTLVYHGDRSDLRPFVHVNVKHPGGSYNTPTQFRLQVKVNGAFRTFTNGEQTLYFTGQADTVRLGGQLDVSDLSTQAYPMEIHVTSQYSGTSVTTVLTTKLVVINERSSSIARGWTVAGVQRLYQQSDSSVIITQGDGSAIYFNHPSAGTYTTPLGAFSRLTLSGSTYRRTYPDSSVVEFNTAGQMLRAIGLMKDTTSLVYDGNGHLSEVRDPLYNASGGSSTRRIVLSYGAYGLSSIADGFGRTTSVTVQSNGRLTSIADPGGGTTSYGYDGNLRLQTTTDRGGNTTTLAYDSWWRVSTITPPAVPINGGSSQSPATQLVSWQRAGTPISTTSGSPMTPPRVDTVRATVTDPEGNVARFTVDRWGQPLVTTDPLSQTTTITRNGNGQPIRVQPPNGVLADSFAYQTSNGFMTYARVGGNVTTYEDGGWLQPKTITGNNGALTETRVYGSDGILDTVRVAGTIVATHRYTTLGRDTLVKDASGHERRFWNDATTGQLDSARAPNGLVTRSRYDRIGRDSLLQVGSNPASLVLYDNLNRRTYAYDSLSATPWQFRYDSLFLREVQNPRGLVRYSEFNALGWLTSAWNSVQGSSVRDSFHYDRDGRRTAWVNRRGQHVNAAFDALGRQLRKWGTNTTSDTTTYTDASRRVAHSNGLVTETTFFDTRLRPESVVTELRSPANRRYRLRYHYASSGVLDSVIPWTDATDALWSRGYAYNSAFSVSQMKFGSGTTTIGRNLEQRTTSYALPTASSLTFTQTRTVMDERYGITASVGFVNAVAGRGIWRDTLDRVRSERGATDSLRVRRYAYDRLGRLVADSAGSYPGCSGDSIMGETCTITTVDSVHAYSYDAVGNRTDHSGSYDTLDRVQSFAGYSFEHDADGNVTRRNGNGQDVRLFWSAEGRLDSVNLVGGTRTSYQYDAMGRLARRSVNGSLDRLFIWQGDQLLAEVRYVNQDTVALVAEYSWYPGMDQPHAVRTPGNVVRYFGMDGVGSVSVLTEDSKPLVYFNYEPWGRALVRTMSGAEIPTDTVRPRWKGAFYEPVAGGMYYMRNRWYDPATGRFVSEDPIGLDGGPNMYAFGYAEPVNARDPEGTDMERNDDSLRIFGDTTGLGRARERNPFLDRILRDVEQSELWFVIVIADFFNQLEGCCWHGLPGWAWSGASSLYPEVQALWPGAYGYAFVTTRWAQNGSGINDLYYHIGHEVLHLRGLEELGEVPFDCSQYMIDGDARLRQSFGYGPNTGRCGR